MKALAAFLNKLPATSVLATSTDDESDASWWVLLELDIRAHMAWHVIQELGHVLNYISINERLPTVFMPKSSPPYMNGGPDAHLSWVIESTADDVDPGVIAKTLAGRLPRPVGDLTKWVRCEAGPCDVPEADDD